MNKLSKSWLRSLSSHSPSSLSNNELHTQISESLSKSVKWKENIEKAEKYLALNLSNFKINNLVKQNKDFIDFTRKRSDLLKIKLGQNKHPIVNVIEKVFGETNNLQSNNILPGFYLCLLAKMTQTVSPLTYTSAIWRRQKAYAEVYEIDENITYLHSTAVVDIDEDSDAKLADDLNSGNKLSILSGDYLYALSMVKMSQDVVSSDLLYLNGLSIDNFCQTNISQRKIDWSTITFKEWTTMFKYHSPVTLANSATGIVKLANLASYEKAAYNFGYNLVIKWNVSA